jgi:hypothetical protein
MTITLTMPDDDYSRVVEAFGGEEAMQDKIAKYATTITLQFEREQAMRDFQPKELEIK